MLIIMRPTAEHTHGTIKSAARRVIKNDDGIKNDDVIKVLWATVTVSDNGCGCALNGCCLSCRSYSKSSSGLKDKYVFLFCFLVGYKDPPLTPTSPPPTPSTFAHYPPHALLEHPFTHPCTLDQSPSHTPVPSTKP